MLLKFTRDAFYNGKLKYKKDQVVEVDAKSGEANRWLIRGMAEEVVQVCEELKEVLAEVKAEEVVVVEEDSAEEVKQEVSSEEAVIEESVAIVDSEQDNIVESKKSKKKAK